MIRLVWSGTATGHSDWMPDEMRPFLQAWISWAERTRAGAAYTARDVIFEIEIGPSTSKL
jgi:hypothetical protein